MAHLLEHLMFRGTRRFPNIKADFQQRGARYNGSTSFDRTNYYETFPASERPSTTCSMSKPTAWSTPRSPGATSTRK